MPHGSSFLANKLRKFVRLSDRELECLAQLQSSTVDVKRGKELVREGQTGHVAYILHSGWACSSKILPDGGRQIITFPVPGDCVGLRSMLLRTADHSFSALTDAVVSRVEAPRFAGVFDDSPRLAAAILLAISWDEALVVEHLVGIVRRSAIERTAHFFFTLWHRLRLVGLATETEFTCPLSQYVLADALGLSAIHVNRVLRHLREQGLMTLKGKLVVIHDASRLKELAGHQNSPINHRVMGA